MRKGGFFSSLSLLLLLVIMGLVANVRGLFDCSQINCNPCQGGNNKVDYLFLLDATTSMGPEIRMVGDGTLRFTESVANRSINARYAVILFGGNPEIIVEWTYDPTIPMAAFPRIQDAAAVPGLHKLHRSREQGFECLRMSQGQATFNTFDSLQTPLDLVWRPDALRFIFFVTDEDSDQPYWSQNRYPGQDTQEPPTTLVSGWLTDRQAASDALIGSSVYLLALINPSETPSEAQYGCPAAEVSDPVTFGNFDPAATLARLGGPSCTASAASLQAEMLRAGQFVRVFLITELSKPGFVSAFFQVAILATPACEGAATCFDATCDVNLGCLYDPLCDDPTNPNDPAPQCTRNCMIGGVCYGFSETKPDNSCLKCNPGADDWTYCNDNDLCTADLCDPGTGCTGTGQTASCTTPGVGCTYDGDHPNVCTLACSRCYIDGACYASNAPHPNPDPALGTNCLYCDPYSNDAGWSNMTFLPGCGAPTNPQQGDVDGDAVPDSSDNCRFVYNPRNASGLQADRDGDQQGDVCDPCPEDPSDYAACRTISLSGDPASFTCTGHGYCGCHASGLGTPACVCETGWFGDKCERPVICDASVDPRYGTANCGAHGTCRLDPGATLPKCQCDPGWTEIGCTRRVLCSGCDNAFSQCVADSVCDCTLSGFTYDPNIQQCSPAGYCPATGCGNGLCPSPLPTTGFGCQCSAGFKIDENMASSTYATCITCPANDITPTCRSGSGGATASGGGTDPNSCTSDASCSSGERCLAGTGGNRCVRTCTTVDECRSGEECVPRSDVANNCEPTCSSDSECSDNKRCTAAVTDGPMTCTEFFEDSGAQSLALSLLVLLLAF